MRSLFLVLVLLFTAGLTGHASEDRSQFQLIFWKEKVDIELVVRWHRNYGEPFVDHEGVCNVRVSDDQYVLKARMSMQFKRCVEILRENGPRVSLTEAQAKRRTVLIRVYEAQTQEEFNTLYRKYKTSPQTRVAMQKKEFMTWCTGYCSATIAAASYNEDKTECNILISPHKEASLGHETKHCFDGAYHATPERGMPEKWIIPAEVDFD